MFLLEFLRVTDQLRFIFLGVVLLVIIVAMPEGLVGGFARARAALSRWIAEGDRPGDGDTPAAPDAEAGAVPAPSEGTTDITPPIPPSDPEGRA